MGGFNGAKAGTGTLSCLTGAQSKALSFDGKTYIKLPKLGAQWSGGFSICAWIRPTEESNPFDRRLFEMANGSTAYNVRLSNKVYAYNGHTNTINTTAVSRGVANYTLQPDTQWQLKGTPWEHWCLTIDNLNPQMKIYRDGLLIGNTVGRIENVDRDSVVIGANWEGTLVVLHSE